MYGRRSVWSNTGILEKSKAFVLLGDEVGRLQSAGDAESRFFQGLARQGFGRGAAGVTQQGVYVFTPGGQLLASDNTREPGRFAVTMDRGLQAWARLPREGRTRGELQKVVRAEDRFPADGLALRLFSRDLGETQRAIGDEGDLWNTDMVWFSRDEMRRFIPSRRTAGASTDLPPGIPARLARLHFLDTVLGQPQMFGQGAVRTAAMRCRVTGVTGDRVDLAITGETHAAQGDRSIRTTILGKATYDVRKDRFVAFEMLATGPRTGVGFRQPYIRNDTGAGTLGYALMLAADKPANRVAPAYFAGYGW